MAIVWQGNDFLCHFRLPRVSTCVALGKYDTSDFHLYNNCGVARINKKYAFFIGCLKILIDNSLVQF